MSLSFDPDSVSLPLGHFIGGKLVPAKGVLPMHRPSDGKEFAHCPLADAALVDEAVEVAKVALKSSKWATIRPRERAKVLHRWAELIELEAETLARLESVASTRPVSQMMTTDIPATVEQIRFFAELADKEGGDLVPTDGSSLGMIMTEPYGVIGAITPWNVPVNMAGWKLGPALAAGNAVVLKPSEMTPFSTLFLAQLAVRAGVPGGLLNVVLGDGPTTGNALTGHEGVSKISFTGSTSAGSAIMANIARTGIKPMTLELGGKSPQLAFADADLDLAANAIAGSILANAGQGCVAGSRLIVEKSVADELTEKVVTRMTSISAGPTWEETSEFSPIISERQIIRIRVIVESAIKAGATCLLGGMPMEMPGYFFAPTLLTNVSADSAAWVEEIFGPVLIVQTFTDHDEAFALADHPTFGLAAGVFTRSLSLAIHATRVLQAGTVWVNRYGRSRDHILPTGGYKKSGIGKDLGREAYLANRRSKSVLIAL